jgi:hypothetical protein
LYFWLSLFLIGATCLIVSEAFFRNVKFEEIARIEGSWDFQGNLTSGKTYILSIASSEEWGKLFNDGTFTEPQPVNITITSPEGGNVTILQAFFFGLPSTSSLYQEGTPPAIVNIEYQIVDDSSLQVTASSSQIRFTVRRTGLYVVRVLQQLLAARDPPLEMLFYEEVVLNKDGYIFLVLSGGLLCIVGGVMSIWSIFGKEKVKRRRMRK